MQTWRNVGNGSKCTIMNYSQIRQNIIAILCRDISHIVHVHTSFAGNKYELTQNQYQIQPYSSVWKYAFLFFTFKFEPRLWTCSWIWYNPIWSGRNILKKEFLLLSLVSESQNIIMSLQCKTDLSCNHYLCSLCWQDLVSENQFQHMNSYDLRTESVQHWVGKRWDDNKV